MEIQTAELVTSLDRYGAFPRQGLPQAVVVGRSNVGKSSLINALCRVHGLAKTSGTPGKTRLINVYLINQAFHLLDLPGYGYARVSSAEQQRWSRMMQGYFSQSQHLRLALHVLDIRHEPSEGDLGMNAFLRRMGIPFHAVATKADKLSRAQRSRMLPVLARHLAVQPWDILPFSAQTGEGRDRILSAMDAALNA